MSEQREGVAYLVLVPVHSRQGTDMGEGVLDGIGELEGVDVPETILNVGVSNELGQMKNFFVSEARRLQGWG